jgi:hypothetical protein
MHHYYTNQTRSGIFLRAIQHLDYANRVTTMQSHVDLYREEYDTGFLPPHLRLHGLAESIHQNAQNCLWDVIAPRICQFDMNGSQVQGLPDSPSINRLGWSDRPNIGNGGYPRGNWERLCHGRDDARGHDSHSTKRPRQQCGLPRLNRNRRPFLAEVQCEACKRVGHVAKHCDMLATAICLKRYMKQDLSPSTHDAIEKEWLTKWRERLGNPTVTSCRVLRMYVKDLDITAANLDNKMDWDCWNGNFDPIPEIADV